MSIRHSNKKTPTNRLPLFLVLGGGLILVVALIIIFSQSASSPATSNDQPALVADQQEINLGDVKLGQYVQASFILTNTGNTLLKFTEAPYIEVREGC
jgi:hypothetical protein